MWYKHVSRWYENGWYEKTLVWKARYSGVQGLGGERDTAGGVSSADGDREAKGAGESIDEELSEDLGGVSDRLAEDLGVKDGGAVGDNE